MADGPSWMALADYETGCKTKAAWDFRFGRVALPRRHVRPIRDR
jgi:hypothetical protein